MSQQEQKKIKTQKTKTKKPTKKRPDILTAWL